ncbi:MAG: Ig-like domain-containing protein [Marinilabiliales bacterium]|nr:Ig-like domain-containing protein [Marinilabiliales bacterium]
MDRRFILLILVTFLSVYLNSCKKDNTVDLAGITLSKTSLTLKPEVAETLTTTYFPDDATNKEVTWSSSNPAVATVDSNGKVTAVSVGSATISVVYKQNNAIKANCDVTVSWTTLNNISGNVSGTWEKNSTINVSGHITVPAGQTLTIEEGVQVIFDDNGVGASHTKIECIVAGKLYCKGTATNPILFSVGSGKRTAANTFGGLWGGIVGTRECSEMLFSNVIMEYTGGDVVADSPSALAGIYTAGGDITPHVTTSNPAGKYVVMNCTFRNGRSDALYFMGGQAIIANNTFIANGQTGGEAINMKAGCKVDAAYNLIFSPNTTGLKLSSSGQDDAAGRGQALIRAFNNTIINSGWRRNGVKGGSVYVEKGALVSVFNNLMVNCKFMTMTPSFDKPSPTGGADNNSVIDYNFYASGSQQSTLTQDNPATLTSFMGYVSSQANYWHDGRNNTPKVDAHSLVSASAGDGAKDPKFVSFGFNNVDLASYTCDASWNFHVQSSSPVLTGAYASFSGSYSPYWGTTGITVNGVEYKTPAPAARFGAFGTN